MFAFRVAMTFINILMMFVFLGADIKDKQSATGALGLELILFMNTFLIWR